MKNLAILAEIDTQRQQISDTLRIFEERVGAKNDELSNHLGNVLATISDKTIFNYGYYSSIVYSAQLYYPFGWEIPTLSYAAKKYRFGFNNQEQDPETGWIHFKYREEDPRVGRFFAVDPMTIHFAYNSPYAFAENRVIDRIELEGLQNVDFNLKWRNAAHGGQMANVVDNIWLYNNVDQELVYTNGIWQTPIEVTAERLPYGHDFSPLTLPKAVYGIHHEALDLIGLVPFFGEGADLLNAASYTLEGDWKNVGYSTASLMPLGGGLVQGSKYANKAIETAGDLSRYKLGPNDLDWRKTGKTYKDALDEAFKKTGFPKDEFVVTKSGWSHTKYGKTIPVDYVHPSGAKVNMDYRHTKEGPDAPHVGYQIEGKRKQKNGEGIRGHIILDEVPGGRITKPD